MKPNCTIYLLLFSLIINSCSRNDSTPPNEIKFDKSSIRKIIPTANADTVFIRGIGEDFSAESMNEHIAKARIKEDSIFIDTYNSGSTLIKVTNANGDIGNIEVDVDTLKGRWYIFSYTQHVVTKNKIFKELIETEMLKEIEKRSHYQFEFYEKDILGFGPEDLSNLGIYSFENRKLKVYVSENSKYPIDEEYIITPSTIDYKYLNFNLDLTNKYKDLYPNADIEKANVILIFWQRTWK